MRLTTIVGTALLAFIVLAGCCNCGKRSSFPFEDTVWQLEQLGGKAVEAEDGNFTVAFTSEGRVSGKGACNTFFGPWKYTGEGENMISVDDVASTMMACINDGETETAFFRMLDEITEYKMEGTKLHLYAGDTLKAVLEGSNKRVK